MEDWDWEMRNRNWTRLVIRWSIPVCIVELLNLYYPECNTLMITSPSHRTKRREREIKRF